jgi:hypothetical protein
MASGRLALTSKAAIYSIALLIALTIDTANQCRVDEVAALGVHIVQKSLPVGQLSDGDLVFRTGRDLMSRLVLSQGELPRFSHVGIILVGDNSVVVVHAIPEEAQTAGGVLSEPLSSFCSLENALDVGFYRFISMDEISRRKVRQYALQQVGKPFDYDFLYSDETRFYCTELVLKALAAAEINIVDSLQHIQVMLLGEPVVPPDYLRRSKLLEIIPLSRYLDDH